MGNLQVFSLLLIFTSTLVVSYLSGVYQRQVIAHQYFRASTISVIMAGLSLFIWKVCISEHDLYNSCWTIGAYLLGDGIGVYGGLRINIGNPPKKNN